VTLLGLKHLDVRTFLSEASACPDLSPIMRNEQQRLTLFKAELSQGCFGAKSGWGVADAHYTSQAESPWEHTAVANLSSETDSPYDFLGSARTGGTLGYHRDPNR
jgi:hypothetical protein